MAVSEDSSEVSVGLGENKMDEQQKKNLQVLKQLRKEELGDGSESEIDAALDQIEA